MGCCESKFSESASLHDDHAASSSSNHDHSPRSSGSTRKISIDSGLASEFDVRSGLYEPELSPRRPFRVVSYNVENFRSQEDAEKRGRDFERVLRHARPDVLMVQEIVGRHGFEAFQSIVANSVGLAGADFINQRARQDLAVFYNDQIFSVEYCRVVPTKRDAGNRDAFEVALRHKATGTVVSFFVIHLQANRRGVDNKLDEEERNVEVSNLKEIIRAGITEKRIRAYVVAGDFNIYGGTEPAYRTLRSFLVDPLSADRTVASLLRGKWNENPAMALYHTQNTRKRGGGLDDRFDMILTSTNLQCEKYEALGNDGSQFNQDISVKASERTPEHRDLLHSLRRASDHLPVIAELSLASKE